MLHARTRRLDDHVDLADVAGRGGLLFERGEIGVAGRGVAAVVEVEPGPAGAAAAQDALASAEVDDDVARPGCGVVAFGALGFDPRVAGRLTVPSLAVGRDEDGSRWATAISASANPPDPVAEVARVTPVGAGPRPGSLRVTSVRPAEEWMATVETARAAIVSGALDKVVLAREITVEADVDLDTATVLARLRSTYPECWISAIGPVLGASPELLVGRRGDLVRAHPLAGTAPRGGDPGTDATLAARLLASEKNRVEHQITIDEVHETLLPWCSYLDAEAEPSVVAVANVQHLGTLVEGRLGSPHPSVLELVDALHPTPAVCGRPRDEALALINRLEQMDRGSYAGPVGWVDGRGNGQFAVGVRTAEFDGPLARVRAGSGIVADSDPEAELAETEAKLQALLAAIVRL